MIYLALLLGLLLATAFLAHYNYWRPKAAPELPRILMYHSIEPGPGSGMNVPPEKFEQQLQQLLKQGYQSAMLSELAALPKDEKKVVITFDDGFRNNYTHAFPLLKKQNMKATIFISPEIEEIETLTESEIREMSDSGLIEFGAHTIHHLNLTTLDDSTAQREIEQSISTVEKVTGKPCRCFAYPFGRYQQKHIEMLKAAGIEMAVSVKKRIRPLDNLFEIPRLGVNGKANRLQFQLILSRGRYRV